MKNLNKIFIACLMLLMTVSLSQPAFAAKTLSLSKNASVSNTGDDAVRTATLDVTLAGGSDVNGLVFTLNYNPAVFTFEGLEKGGMDIDDGSSYDPENPPTPETISSTLYYQVNNKADQGIVMIAAAAANFFTADFVAFKAKFKVKQGIGSGKYKIGIQKTIIGPDTAANAGYTKPTSLEVAAGLDPAKDPTTAQTYPVDFVPGEVTVTGGYDVKGTVFYGSVPEAPANGAVVNLIQVLNSSDLKIRSQVVAAGAYTFATVPKGSYKVEVISTTPGFQKRFVSQVFVVDADVVTVDKITLAKFAALSGTVTINNQNLAGLRIEIRDENNKVMAQASVDANGKYVTPPLPADGNYKTYAVYGAQEIEVNSSTFDWTLALGSVSGIIDDLCADQVVELLIRSETTRLQTSVMVTGADGTEPYTLTNLLPGTDYILSMVGEGVGPVYYNNTKDFNSATKVSVVADQDTDGKDFAFDCNDFVTISGTITVGGSPVVGATVKANNFIFSDHNYKFGSAVTTAGGLFTIQVTKSADYYVFFNHNNKDYYYSMGTTGPVAVTQRSLATRVDVTAGNAENVNIPAVITIPDTAKLEGYVTLNRPLDDGGIPMKNYLVSLYTTANVPLPFVARTDKDGYYQFVNMTPGTYNVALLPPAPYARQVVEKVVLTNDTTATADFIVGQNYEITGLVMDADVANTPVVSARVDIVKSTGGKLRSPTYTNISGAYTLVDIPSGVYTLFASHRDYFPESQEETVSADLTATTIEMSKGAIIEGVVSDGNGIVAGATVTLTGPGYVKSVKTDKLGKYQFRGLAASTQHIIKAAKGNLYASFEAESIDTGLVGETTTHDILLTIPVTAYKFSGAVTEDGNQVANAYALLFSTTTYYQKVVQTNAAGEFAFTNVISGTDYSLLVLPGDNKPAILEDGISITDDVAGHAVAVPTIAFISGTITLSEADATALILVGAYDPATDMAHEVRMALDSGNNKTFTYTIKVKSGVDYKVFAQDLNGTFPLRYYVSGAASGTSVEATIVDTTTTGADITLTK